MNETSNVYIGSDHRGFELKEKLKGWLSEAGHTVTDCGNVKLDEADDYPVFALAVAEQVSKSDNALGIVLCGSGVGVTVAANKVKGVRASVGLSPVMVEKGRHDDDQNVLVIAADFQDEEEAKSLITAFLNTSPSSDDRYQRRLRQITEYENQN